PQRLLPSRHHLGNAADLRHPGGGRANALPRDPFADRRIHRDLANAQMVILEYLEAALFLHGMMLGLRAPADDRLFVAPARKRQQAAFRVPAREAIDIDESIDRLQLRLQVFGEREILVELFRLWLEFKDHREHRWLSISPASAHAIFSPAVLAKTPSVTPTAWSPAVETEKPAAYGMRLAAPASTPWAWPWNSANSPAIAAPNQTGG